MAKEGSNALLLYGFVSKYSSLMKHDALWLSSKSKLPKSDGRIMDFKSEQWRRAVFLEDPLNALGIFTQTGDEKASESDVLIKECLSIVTTLKEQGIIPSLSIPPTHLKPISYITSKVNHLFDVKAIIVERIPTTQYAISSPTVSEWTFFLLADETGSVVGAFPHNLPIIAATRQTQSLLSSVKTNGSKNQPSASPSATGINDIVSPNDIILLYAMKVTSIFGSSVSLYMAS